MARRPGIYGPYRHGNRYRLVVVRHGGGQDFHSYETEEKANEVKKKTERKLELENAITVEKAIERYELYMRDVKGNKQRSIDTTVGRLQDFFVDELGRPVPLLTNALCKGLYDQLVARKTGNLECARPIAVDTHRNTLNQTRTFLKWCVGEKYLTRNPLEGVSGVGKRRHGKSQLRVDEARKWFVTAQKMAELGSAGAIAAMTSLLMGMRASEIVQRVVRDLDDQGRLLWIPVSKTESGRRKLEVPELLQPHLLQLARGKLPEAFLFGNRKKSWPRYWVHRICDAAGVPRVCAHSMRGLHASLAVEAGSTGHVVAASLGHSSFAVTQQSYLGPGVEQRAHQRSAMRVLEGGKSRARLPDFGKRKVPIRFPTGYGKEKP